MVLHVKYIKNKPFLSPSLFPLCIKLLLPSALTIAISLLASGSLLPHPIYYQHNNPSVKPLKTGVRSFYSFAQNLLMFSRFTSAKVNMQGGLRHLPDLIASHFPPHLLYSSHFHMFLGPSKPLLPQDLRMWLFLEMGPLKEGLNKNKAVRVVLIQSDWGSWRRGGLDTQGNITDAHTQRKGRVNSRQGGGCVQAKDRDLRTNPTCQYLDLGMPASNIMRNMFCCCLSHPLCGILLCTPHQQIHLVSGENHILTWSFKCLGLFIRS